MDIQKVLLGVMRDRDHEAMMCAELCAIGLWDLASERARKYAALNEKIAAILEGRAKQLYGIPDFPDGGNAHIEDELSRKRLAE